MANAFHWDRFHQLPIVGILRGFETAQAEHMVAAAAAGGLQNVEVTLNTKQALEQIKRLREVLGNSLNIGAGTVCSLDDYKAAREAGANFIVTPHVVPEILQQADVPVFSGAFSPGEIYQAWTLKAAMVKVFPADVLGTAYLRALRGPYPQIPLMPTGGVSLETIAEFKKAGAKGYGIGSPLFSSERAAASDWAWFTAQTQKYVNILNQA